MTQNKHVNFHAKKNELHQIQNAKILHFKDQKGKAIDGQLIIGEVESIREKEFYKPVEVEVERNLGRFKKVLAYLGVIIKVQRKLSNKSYIRNK